MNKAHVIGRRITDIKQERVTDKNGDQVWDVQAIYLDNGTVLTLSTVEMECDYATDIAVHRKVKR